jgi:hypothetical protein
MFKAFCFVLALTLCTSALSTAHAALSPKETSQAVTLLSKAVKAASWALASACAPFAWCRNRYLMDPKPNNPDRR